jgi:hypothetical protein
MPHGINGRLACAYDVACWTFDNLGLIVAELQRPIPGVYGGTLHRRLSFLIVAPLWLVELMPKSGTIYDIVRT